MNPITFSNRKGLKLFGIIHIPAQPRKDVGIIILNPGIKSRVGPHRLYVRMAKIFCDQGFYVLRFDSHGIGDSEGEIDEKLAADFYATVQLGRYTEDTRSAMDWMEKEYGTKRFILTGLCGGAITALHAGAQDIRVDQVIGIGMPVSLNGSKVDPYRYISRGQLDEIRKGYLGKMTSGKAWLRFFTFQSDYRLIAKSLKSPAKELSGNNINSGNIETNSNNNLNPLFPEVFHRVASNRKVSLIFSGADRLHWEFEEKYKQSYAPEFHKFINNIGIHIIKNANHILSFKEWQDEMLVLVSSELKLVTRSKRSK